MCEISGVRKLEVVLTSKLSISPRVAAANEMSASVRKAEDRVGRVGPGSDACDDGRWHGQSIL